jgi:glycine dehydrogenase subunit 1
MANAINRRKRVVVSGTINPLRLGVLEAYLQASGIEIHVTGREGGLTDIGEIGSSIKDDTCCMVLENPNFFGLIEDGAPVADAAKAHGALFIVVADPISLGMLAPPAAYGADIVVGEGQALGNRLSFGGPYLGFMATRRDFIRRLPGRIVGKTVDAQDRPCFCLTLQTREQHIRRERATSNICTNQALNALRAAVYLCWLGKHGIGEVAGQCLSKTVYARDALSDIGIPCRFSGPFFREFVVDLPVGAEAFAERMAEHRILAGLPMSRFYPDMPTSLLVCLTEKRSKQDIERLVEVAGRTIEDMEAAS